MPPTRTKAITPPESSSSSERHYCPEGCGVSTSRKYDLQRHLDTHNVNTKFRYSCPAKCGLGFRQASNIRQHLDHCKVIIADQTRGVKNAYEYYCGLYYESHLNRRKKRTKENRPDSESKSTLSEQWAQVSFAKHTTIVQNPVPDLQTTSSGVSSAITFEEIPPFPEEVETKITTSQDNNLPEKMVYPSSTPNSFIFPPLDQPLFSSIVKEKSILTSHRDTNTRLAEQDTQTALASFENYYEDRFLPIDSHSSQTGGPTYTSHSGDEKPTTSMDSQVVFNDMFSHSNLLDVNTVASGMFSHMLPPHLQPGYETYDGSYHTSYDTSYNPLNSFSASQKGKEWDNTTFTNEGLDFHDDLFVDGKFQWPNHFNFDYSALDPAVGGSSFDSHLLQTDITDEILLIQ